MVLCIQCNCHIGEAGQYYRLSDLGSELVVEELINVKPNEEEYICELCFRALYKQSRHKQSLSRHAVAVKQEYDAFPPDPYGLVEQPVIVIKNECVWPELTLQGPAQPTLAAAAADRPAGAEVTHQSFFGGLSLWTALETDTSQVPAVAAEIEVADTEAHEEISLDDIKIEPMDVYSVDMTQHIKIEMPECAFGGATEPCFVNSCWMPESSILKTQNMFRYRQRASPRRAAAARAPRPRREYKRRGDSEVHNNGVTVGSDCEVCGIRLTNDVQARKHYTSEHPGVEYLRRYMCDICGHTTKQYSNLLVHMRRHTLEKPFACPHCDRRFSMPSNRDRHLLIHTGEKPYECVHCHRRFTQSTAMKLHVQTVHLKIPYAPWDRKNRKRKKEAPPAPPALPPAHPPAHATEPKLVVDASGEYINAYLTYGNE